MTELPREDKLASIHHYVPQGYLLRFSPDPKKGQIYAYEEGREPYLTSVRNVAGQKGYYNFVDTDGTKTSELEEAFALIDTEGLRIISKLDSGEPGFIELTDEDRGNLLSYIAFLHCRNVSRRQQMADSFSDFSILQMQMYASVPEHFHKMAKEALGKKYDYVQAEKERIALLDGKMRIEMDSSQQYFMGRALEISRVLYDVLWLQKRILIVEAEPGLQPLVTSDSPVTYYPPDGHPKGAPLGYIQAIFQLPISPTRCILLVNDNMRAKTFSLDSRLVDWHNYYTFRDAVKWIFSNDKLDKITENFKKFNNKEPRFTLDSPFSKPAKK